MSAPSFTYSGNVYTAGTAGTVDFALTSTTGNSIPYLEPGHIHVYKSSNQGTSWTELTRPAQWDFVTSGTVARLVTGIAAGEWVKVQRITPSSAAYVTFQASSLLTADQLNDDTLFNTYLNQERYDQGDQSSVVAAAAQAASASATTTANTALSTANAASASAASAVTTANTASTNASAAVATANTASANASAAVSTANTASTNASAAVTTANTASTNASAAVATANTALSTANSAVTTANNANTTAQAANTTAANAQSVANSALNLVTGVVNFVPVANVAAIPASPNNDDAVQVVDSTGIQSFTPLTGLPAGFTGTPQLFVRLQYNSTGTTWEYSGYGANDPDKRYVVQGVLGTANNPSFYFDADTGFYSPGSNELGLSTGGAARLTIDSSGNVAVPGTLSVTGALTKGGNNVVTTGDTGTVTSTMLADGTVVDADISGTAAISLSKLATGALPSAITVASSNIVDGTIVDADINASAAIAGTKISPDFGSQNVTTTGTATAAALIPSGSTVPTNGVYLPAANNVAISTNGTGRLFVDSSGNVGIGITTLRNNFTASPSSAFAQIEGTSFTSSSLSVTRNSNDSGGSNIFLGKSRGTTNGSNTIVSNGDQTGVIRFCAADGTNLAQSAEIKSEIDGVPASGAVPGRLVFSTTPSGSASPSERLRITSDGKLGLGTSSPQHRLQVVSSGGQSTIAIGDTAASTYSNLLLYGGSGKYNWSLGAQYNKDDAFEITRSTVTGGTTFSTPALVVDSSSRVGIGSTSPVTALHVTNGTNSDRLVYVQGVATGLRLGANTNGGVIEGVDATDGNTSYRTLRVGGSDILLQTNGIEKARIDSSGRLLVGTSTALASAFGTVSPRLQIATTTSGPISFFSYANDAFAARLDLSKSRGTTVGTNTVVADGDDLGDIYFNGADGTNFIPAGLIRCEIDGTPGTNDMPGRLVFSTTADGASTPTERMRIANDGLHSSYSNAIVTVWSSNYSASAGNNIFIGRYGATAVNGGSDCIYIRSNGNIQNTNNSYGAISDIKLKENIVDANSQWDDMKALQVRNYNFKEGQTHTQIGLVAQEVELVSPGLVSESPDRDAEGNDLGTVTKSVNYSVLYMKAVKALQEAMERIEQLEAKVAALEGA